LSSKPNDPKPLRIMLVDDDPRRATAVEESLRASGHEVLSIISSTPALLYQIDQHRPDVVLIDIRFPGRDVLESLAVVNRHNPTPMVMFAEEQDPSYIQEAFAAGVSTYLMEGINPTKVKPVIDVALLQFRNYQALKEELSETREELEIQKKLARAKALLMKQKRIDEDAAHRLLLQMAMDNNLKLGDVARMVVATLSMVPGSKNP
jgi:two-component system, response regulator / RNA-binding antiterminator